jgi:hypothetical protein
VEPELLTYLQEVASTAAGIQDVEERSLLLGNVLEEIGGNEQRIASDAAASRLLEQLLGGASVQHLMAFMGAFEGEEALWNIASR